jgi:hypothetical protein
LAKLADVATGNALISGGVSTAPAWGKIGLTTHVSGTLPTTNGGTNLTSFTANGVMYASSSSVLATGSVLTFDGAQLTVNSVTVGRGGGAISSNTAIGTSALGANTTGNQQVCVGVSAGAALTTQVNNTFVGYQVGASATGNRNIGVGTNVQGFYNSALYSVSGNDNVAIGPAAGSGITSGSTNVAIGATNGGNLSAGITGSCNVMIGWGVGASLTSGSNNTMIGAGRAGFAYGAGSSLTSGSTNNFFGRSAGSAITTGSANSVLGTYDGNSGGLDIRTLSNYTVLSDGDGNIRAYWDNSGYMISAGVYSRTSASAANVYVDSTGALYRSTSALKYKQDVRDLEEIDVSQIRPVRYKSKCEGEDHQKDYFGVIADEVDAAGIKELVTYGENGEVEGFQYERLTVVLLKEIQMLRLRVAQLENK